MEISCENHILIKMKEIIDLEETVCLPRYTCNRRSNEVQSIFNPDIAFTDSINQNVSKSTLLYQEFVTVDKARGIPQSKEMSF